MIFILAELVRTEQTAFAPRDEEEEVGDNDEK